MFLPYNLSLGYPPNLKRTNDSSRLICKPAEPLIQISKQGTSPLSIDKIREIRTVVRAPFEVYTETECPAPELNQVKTVTFQMDLNLLRDSSMNLPPPSPFQIHRLPSGNFIANSLHDMPLTFTYGKKRDLYITKVSETPIPFGHSLFVSQRDLAVLNHGYLFISDRELTIKIRVFSHDVIGVDLSDLKESRPFYVDASGQQADFGPMFLSQIVRDAPLVVASWNLLGCMPHSAQHHSHTTGAVLFLMRGDCTFWEKISNAQAAGARAVVIINTDDALMTMHPPENVNPVDIRIPSIIVQHQIGTEVMNGILLGQWVEIDVFPDEPDMIIDDQFATRKVLQFDQRHVKNLILLTELEYERTLSTGSLHHVQATLSAASAAIKHGRRRMRAGMSFQCLSQCPLMLTKNQCCAG
jgi:hypothetical protein